MAKARTIDAKLAQLRALRAETAIPAHLAALRESLADKSNFVVAAAAEIVGERVLADLAPDMVAAFHRFLVDPVETDKQCRAKIALTDALNKIEYDDEGLFRIGVRHVQNEPRWGGSDDTAAPLRAAAAFALMRLNPRDLMYLLGDLLADPEKVARCGAAKALGASDTTASVAMLRLKARIGDKESEVTAECLTALVTADPVESLLFVEEFLRSHDEEIASGAALAIAESRRPQALDILKRHESKTRSESLREVLLLAIAITRLPAALDYLLEILAGPDARRASAALAALAIHRHNPAVRERISSIVATSGFAELRRIFAKDWSVERYG